MNKYAVIKYVNGSFTIDSEWNDKNGAIMQWHNICRILWSSEDVENATVELVDENLSTVPGYIENIRHEIENVHD